MENKNRITQWLEKYLEEMYDIHKKKLMQKPYPKIIWIKKIPVLNEKENKQ